MKRPLCKCGNPCERYGGVGGYSVACIECNAHRNKLSRASRARLKAKSQCTLLVPDTEHGKMALEWFIETQAAEKVKTVIRSTIEHLQKAMN